MTDPERLPTWQTNTVFSVPDGPMAVGTRLREVHRAPGGKGQLTGAMRLAQPLLQRVLKRQFAQQCETLKRLLETQAVPA